MVQKITLFLGMISIATMTSAQSTLGIQAGITYNMLDYQADWGNAYLRDTYTAPLMGISLGVQMEYLKKEQFSLSSNFAFIQTGGQESATEDELNRVSPDLLKMHYLSFGTQFNFNPLRKKLRLQFGVGPRVDYLIGGKDGHPLDWYVGLNAVRRLNYGVNMGIGFFKQSGNVEFGLQAYYAKRFRNLINAREGVYNGQARIGAIIMEHPVVINFCISKVLAKKNKEAQPE